MKNDWGDKLDVRYYLMENLAKIYRSKVLDVGCGDGFLLASVSNKNFKYGVDIDKIKLKEAGKINQGAIIKKASMYSLPFPAYYFDVVIMANVLEVAGFPDESAPAHILQERAIKEINRVLKSNGRLFLTTPNNAYYKSKKLSYFELNNLLRPYFDYKIKGWNPFPKFPYFLPARILRFIPGWFSLLSFLCEHCLFAKKSKFFYVEALKK